MTVTQSGGADAPLQVAIAGRRPAQSAASRTTEALTRLLGLEVDLSGFYTGVARDRRLAPLAARYRGLKPPRFPTLFECLLNAVACQQLSLAAGLGLAVLSHSVDASGSSRIADDMEAPACPGRI